MRTLGLIGGMSWESTLLYYRAINQAVMARLGGLHSAKLVLWSVDFAEIADLQAQQRWHDAGERLADAAKRLEAAGAEAILICTNTMHKVAPQVAAAVRAPLLHIAEALGTRLREHGITRIGLLGTRFTMEQDFYRDALRDMGIDMRVPDETDRDHVHRIIFDELCRGQIRDDSRDTYRRTIARLIDDGAQAIVFGCTEIGMLVSAADSAVPVFDTTTLHAEAAVAFALGG